MCTDENNKQTFLQHLPVPLWHVVKSFELVINPGFICWKHMQISSKPVVQAWDDFEILMQTSKGEQINVKFLFIQFYYMLAGEV